MTERDRLDGACRRGDPAADMLVRELAKTGRIWTVNGLLRGIETRSQPLPRELPSSVRAFLDKTARLPAWARLDLIEHAQAWSRTHLVHIVAGLFCAALPWAFAGAKGAEVLLATGRVQHDIDRRVHETGRFVLDVLEEASFEAGGRAVRAVQKVRLMHAAVRHHLAGVRAFDGVVPINQEELLGTLFCFSLVTMQAAHRLGAQLTGEDTEAYLHLWCVVGSLLGIEAALLPRGLDDARALADRVHARQVASSDAGRALARSLVIAMERHMPGPLLKPLPRLLMRELGGPELCTLLGVSGAGAVDRRLFAAIKSNPITRGATRGLTLAVSELVGRRLIDGLLTSKLEGQRPHFAMPMRRRLHADS